MHSGFFWQIIYWLSTPVFAILAVLLPRRGLHREFPLFFSYIAASLLSDLVRLGAYQSTITVYTNTFWVTEAIITVFALLATYELCMKRLFAAFYRIRSYRSLFPATAFVIVVLALLTAMTTNKKTYILVQAIHIFDVVRVAMLLFFVGLMLLMGRTWSKYEFAIAFGLGIDSAAFLTLLASWTKASFLGRFARDARVFAYDIACLLWLITFATSKERKPAQTVTPELIEEAKKWEETLKNSLTDQSRPD